MHRITFKRKFLGAVDCIIGGTHLGDPWRVSVPSALLEAKVEALPIDQAINELYRVVIAADNVPDYAYPIALAGLIFRTDLTDRCRPVLH